jgi:hypothetical protein
MSLMHWTSAHFVFNTFLIGQAPINSSDLRNNQVLADLVENIQESLGVEPSTATADADDDQLEAAMTDRILQEQVIIVQTLTHQWPEMGNYVSVVIL